MLVRRLQILGLVIGPAIFALSPFFWVDGHYGMVGGLLIAVSTVPWVFGLVGEYERLRPHLPVSAGLWLLLVLVGMFGSIAFGLQGFAQEAVGDTSTSPLDALARTPVLGTIVMVLSGPMFPTALFILSFFYWRTRLAPAWASALMCAAAVAFPIARVARIDVVAIVADVLTLLAFCAIAWHAWPASDRDSGSRPARDNHAPERIPPAGS